MLWILLKTFEGEDLAALRHLCFEKNGCDQLDKETVNDTHNNRTDRNGCGRHIRIIGSQHGAGSHGQTEKETHHNTVNSPVFHRETADTDTEAQQCSGENDGYTQPGWYLIGPAAGKAKTHKPEKQAA